MAGHDAEGPDELVYELDESLKPVVAGGTYLDPEAAAAAAEAVANQGKAG